ncbi:ELMO domain-containing protein 3 isoform X2 [Electrophorus electricus]|uniref:ELMO domain-containing protein 3 isoform X2 n=1 Tax=Electrophorus electricus TaxID=8005 RepID=UPI0015CF8B5F|nr:ELMO domain-containing protein 3 isoform X2 [Electrophorus electricus]
MFQVLERVPNGFPPGDGGGPHGGSSCAPISALKQNGLLQTLTEGQAQMTADDVNSELERAQQEWDALESIQPVPVEDLTPSPLISFNEALQHFQTTDLGDMLRTIQPTVRRTGLAALTHFLFGPPRLHRELIQERDLVFAIAQCSLDNSQPVHMRVLQTVYRKLTCTRVDCPRYGPHWENVGFQGTDPATDLRGTGLLGLMHALYLLMDPETLPLARDIYRLSQHPVQNFPFSVMSINVSRIALHALREEVLSRECNRRQQVVGVLNEFYAAAFRHLYQVWRREKKTISDSGYVLKEVELYAKKYPKQLLRGLDSYLQERRAVIGHRTSPDTLSHSNRSPGDRESRASSQTGREGKEMNFTGVCDLPPEMEGEARLI